jgi:hypothetical protein
VSIVIKKTEEDKSTTIGFQTKIEEDAIVKKRIEDHRDY